MYYLKHFILIPFLSNYGKLISINFTAKIETIATIFMLSFLKCHIYVTIDLRHVNGGLEAALTAVF